MSRQIPEVPQLDRMIHEPARLMIVATLFPVKEADFLFLQRTTELTKGNLSSHLSKLEEAGYVNVAKTYRGKTPLTLCSLTAEGRTAFRAYQEAMKHFLQ